MNNKKKRRSKKYKNKKKIINNIKKEETIVHISKVVKVEDKKRKIYIGYTARLIILTIFIITTLFTSTFILLKSINFIDGTYLNYKEKSAIDYKVYLKENDFYEQDYLEKDMIYIANLIDNIKLNFNYKFVVDEEQTFKFDYDIVGELLILDSNTQKVFFTKEYNLLNNKILKTIDNEYELTEEIDIDYDYYNQLANKFKSSYGVDVESKLLINLVVNKDNNKDIKLDKKSTMTISIPLSQKAINIKLDYKDINETHSLIDKSKYEINNYLRVIVSIILYSVSIYLILKLFKLILLVFNRKSEYDKYVEKILFQYDRVIVESKKTIKFNDKNIIEVKDFSELLDVRDNLKVPIIYTVIHKHQKCYFYIKDHNDIYLLVIKSIDFKDFNNAFKK